MAGKLEYCPNCGEREKIERVNDKAIFCPKCDMTFGVMEGKPKSDPAAKSTIEELRNENKDLKGRIEKVEGELFNKKRKAADDDGFGF